jgi:tetratricopeptide (TPR) repeat protein
MSRLFASICLAVAGGVSSCLWAVSPAIGGPVELDDNPATLSEPPRSEAEQDRLEAVSLFAAGRLMEQRQEFDDALRAYERAFRLDPTAEPVLRAIIPLAFTLEREEEAVRYATKLAELDTSDPMLLRRLGVVLTEQRQFDKALSLYEKVRQQETGRPKTAAHVMLLLEMGRLYVLTEQFKRAAESFETVAEAFDAPKDYEINPTLLKSLVGDKGQVHELMAVAFLEAGRTQLAAKAFERLEKLNPNAAIAAYNQARVAAKEAHYESALEKLDQYFAARETAASLGPYELLEQVLKELGRSDELLPRLEKLAEEQPGNVPLHFSLGERYFQRDALDKAEKHLQTVQASRPSRDVYRRLVEIYSRTGQDEKLIQILGEVLSKTGSLESVEKQLEPLVENSDQIERLVALCRDKFAEPKPEHHDVLQAAALLAADAKRYDEAAELIDLAVKAKPADKAQALLRYGLGLLLAERVQEAAGVFQRAIDEKALPESNPAFYFYLAGALAMEGKTQEALRAAKAATEKKPDDPRLASRVPWIYYHAKQYDEAARHYRELIKKFGDNYESDEARSVVHDARLILSNIAVLQGKLPEAEEWIELVLDEFPDDAGALNDLGYLWADQNKRVERAHRMIRRAVELEPDNAAYRDSLGWVLYRLGRFEAAAAEQQKAVELFEKQDKESDGVMYDHLGDIHAALKRMDQARTAWRKAAAAFERSNEMDKLEAVTQKINAPTETPN